MKSNTPQALSPWTAINQQSKRKVDQDIVEGSLQLPSNSNRIMNSSILVNGRRFLTSTSLERYIKTLKYGEKRFSAEQ